MPDGGKDAIGMPLGAVAKRLEVEGKTKITCHGNMPYTLLRGSLVWQVRSKSPHLLALSPAESHRRQVRMAGDFRVRLAGGVLWDFAGPPDEKPEPTQDTSKTKTESFLRDCNYDGPAF